MSAIALSNGALMSNGSNGSDEVQQELKDLSSLRSCITLKLSDAMIKVGPSQQFLTWLKSKPLLSVKDLVLIENFYEDKSVHKYKFKLTNKGQQIYNTYMEEFSENDHGIIYLDNFFVDETCVHFLYYRNQKIMTCEIMLE